MSELAPLNDELARRSNDAHLKAVTNARQALEHALEVGRLLTEAKATARHGAWLPWLRDNCTMSERSAQAYMRLWSSRDHIEKEYASDPQRVADFSVRGA